MLHERVVVVVVSAFRETGFAVKTVAKNTEDESIERIVIVIANDGRRRR
jgi:hypothetical protein